MQGLGVIRLKRISVNIPIYKWQGKMKYVGKMRKAELSLETMSPVGRNDSMCTNVFSLCLNDSRYAAVLIGLHGLWGSEGARANVIMHAPKPQTMHGLRDPGSRSATTPGVSATASFASGFLSLFFFYLIMQLWTKSSCEGPGALLQLLNWKVQLNWKVALAHDSLFKTVFAARLYQCTKSKGLSTSRR